MISLKFVYSICMFLLLAAVGTDASGQDNAGSLPGKVDEMTLADCINIAVKENITIRNAYLDRVVQKYDLRVAEDQFMPKMLVNSGIQRSGGSTSSASTAAGLSAALSETLPIGTTINLTPSYSFNDLGGNNESRSYGWNVNLSQPLLKGGGWDVNTASLRMARMGEQNNILSLKATIMDTLSAVITSYRSYVQAIKALEISQQSFQRSKELVDINRELIDAGRMAPIDLVQSEADVANQEFSLLTAENSLDAARLALVKILDLDKKTLISPTQEFTIEPIPYTLEQAIKLALENRPDYQSALLGLELSKISLMLAKNSTLWDLSLSAGYGKDYFRGGVTGTNSDGHKWNTGLNLTIPFWDLAVEQGHLNAKISLQKTEINLKKQREDLEIEVQDALRNTEMNLRQVKLAQLSRELSVKKFEIESEKLKAGRSTNFQLVSFQNDLVNAQNNELNSIISYLNALTTFERTLGITLDRWGIALVERQGEYN